MLNVHINKSWQTKLTYEHSRNKALSGTRGFLKSISTLSVYQSLSSWLLVHKFVCLGFYSWSYTKCILLCVALSIQHIWDSSSLLTVAIDLFHYSVVFQGMNISHFFYCYTGISIVPNAGLSWIMLLRAFTYVSVARICHCKGLACFSATWNWFAIVEG